MLTSDWLMAGRVGFVPDLPGLRPVLRRRAREMGPGFWRQLHEAAARLDPELAARIDCGIVK